MVRASVSFVCLLLTGCGESPVWIGPPVPDAPAIALARPAPARSGNGRVAGRVYGVGAIPKVEDFYTAFVSADFRPIHEIRPNPLRPRIDPATLAVAGAWISTPVAESPIDEAATLDIRIDDDRIGFPDRPPGSVFAVVAPGTIARIRSTGTRFQMLRGTGIDEFTVPLMRDGSGARRAFLRPDLIELTNPAGAWWQRAWVVVGSPAHNCISDTTGHYELTGVSPGRREIVVRLPHPGVRTQDRNPDVGSIVRMWYRPMIEIRTSVDVPETGTVTLDLPIDLKLTTAP